MPKIFIITSCFILYFITQLAQSTPVGAVEKLEGEWIIQHQKQTSRIFTTEDQKLKWMPLYIGDQYILKSEKGCLHYWLVEKINVNYHSFCPQQGEQLTIPSQGTVQFDLSSIALSLSTQRNETQQQLNINTHLPAKTVIVENTLNLSWAEFEPKQSLKAIYLDNQLLSSVSSTGNKVSLPVKDKAGWQKWMIILSNGSRYNGQVKKLSLSEFSAINQVIKSLNVVEPKGKALSRAFIFLENQLYLNAWQVFYTLYQEDKSTGVSHLVLATELAMGRATHTLKVEH